MQSDDLVTSNCGGDAALLNEDLCCHDLASGITDLKRLAGLGVDEVDANLSRRPDCRCIGRNVANDITETKILHNVIVNRWGLDVGLKHVGASARDFCQVLEPFLASIPVDTRKRCC